MAKLVLFGVILTSLKKKIEYYLLNDGEARNIANAGQQLAFERHSFDNRVAELFELISEPEAEHWRL